MFYIFLHLFPELKSFDFLPSTLACACVTTATQRLNLVDSPDSLLKFLANLLVIDLVRIMFTVSLSTSRFSWWIRSKKANRNQTVQKQSQYFQKYKTNPIWNNDINWRITPEKVTYTEAVFYKKAETIQYEDDKYCMKSWNSSYRPSSSSGRAITTWLMVVRLSHHPKMLNVGPFKFSKNKAAVPEPGQNWGENCTKAIHT